MPDELSRLAVQIHALTRVLHHLSEEQQAPRQPDIKLFLSAEKYLAALNAYDRAHAAYLDHYQARAQARVEVKRRLSFAESSASIRLVEGQHRRVRRPRGQGHAVSS